MIERRIEHVLIDYTNWKGERRERRIMPLTIKFGTNEWHRDRQWLLFAIDVEAAAHREFALKDIHNWRPV